MPAATPAEFLREMNLQTLNAHTRFQAAVQHAQERLARDLDEIVAHAELAIRAVTESCPAP